jgi:hypothetical protein
MERRQGLGSHMPCDRDRGHQLYPIVQVVSVAIQQLQLQFQDTFSYHEGAILHPLHLTRTNSIQVAVNQALFTPIFNSYFFGMQSLLSGATGPEIVERIKNTVPTSWINSCKLWPIVTAFSFTYIPIQYRSIFGGVIAIGWQTYLSLLNQRAAAKEEMEHETGQEAAVIVRVAEVECRQEKQKCAA